MLKKTLALSAAMAMTVGLAACGGADEQAETETSSATGATTTEQTTTPAATPTTGAQTTNVGTEFAMMAAMSDMFEIESSRIALQKAQSPQVKQFAQMMIDDHTRMSNDMKAAVQAAGLTVTPPTQLSGDYQTWMSDLQQATGDDFGDKYLDHQQEAHERALALMENYAANGDTQQLKTLAAAAVPKIRAHLEMARRLDDSDANDNTGAAGAAPATRQ